jgi:hypothetical protein
MAVTLRQLSASILEQSKTRNEHGSGTQIEPMGLFVLDNTRVDSTRERRSRTSRTDTRTRSRTQVFTPHLLEGWVNAVLELLECCQERGFENAHYLVPRSHKKSLGTRMVLVLRDPVSPPNGTSWSWSMFLEFWNFDEWRWWQNSYSEHNTSAFIWFKANIVATCVVMVHVACPFRISCGK